MHRHPTKVLNFCFGLRTPQFARLKGRVWALKFYVIRKGRGVHSIGHPFPLNEDIFILSQVNMFDKAPKLDELNELLP
jgi:hypothetical protein